MRRRRPGNRFRSRQPCHRFPRFVYQQAHFSSDRGSIEISAGPRKGWAAVCSPCHQAPRVRSTLRKAVHFFPGFSAVLDAALRFPPLSGRRRRGSAVGRRQAILTRARMLFLAAGRAGFPGRKRPRCFALHEKKVFDAVEHVVIFELEHRTLGQIDPIASTKSSTPKRDSQHRPSSLPDNFSSNR